MKRGESGLSLLIGVDKPKGMTSHDVVNRVRRIFGERRVGHTGTLDPLASGVLPICIGPATRLNNYLTSHDKRYLVTVRFGEETSTDDSEGEVVASQPVPSHLFDEDFARSCVRGLIGTHEQVPPAYSAVKVDGKKSYERARKGEKVDLQPRTITVYDAELLLMNEVAGGSQVEWIMTISVSKGTYIRSLARDLGRAIGCPAHVSELSRSQAGRITAKDCFSLEALESMHEQGISCAIDPVRALGLRFAFVDDFEKTVSNGGALNVTDVKLYHPLEMSSDDSFCACTSGICASEEVPKSGELICLILANRLKAIYEFDSNDLRWHSRCQFAVGVSRV